MQARCTKCGVWQCDDSHQFWDREALDKSELIDVKKTQDLKTIARIQKDTYPCLWVRGILPKEMVSVKSQPIEEHEVFDKAMYYHADDDQRENMKDNTNIKKFFFKPGTYGTDASGGPFGSYDFRRCTCGIVSVCEDSMEVLTGLSFPLPGEIQTVPRAELYAIKFLVCNCFYGIIDITSDSLTNVDTFNDPDKSKMQKSLNAGTKSTIIASSLV